jgi:hypothetical protein
MMRGAMVAPTFTALLLNSAKRRQRPVSMTPAVGCVNDGINHSLE